MQGNHFYDRLNQIRSKYGYFDQKGPSKQNNLSFGNPQPHLQSYFRTPLSNQSPKRQPPQNTAISYSKPFTQKTSPMGPSLNSTFERESTQHNTSFIGQNKMSYKQPTTQRSLNQTPYTEKFQSAFNKPANENLSPSPIKKLGIDSSYQSSPLRKDKVLQRSQDYQALKPYNRSYEAVPTLNQKERQLGQPFRRQADYARPSKETLNSDVRKPLWEQGSFEKQSLYARSTNHFDSATQRLDSQDNSNREVAFSEKFSYNVNSIDKIQDKINSILHRQK